MSSQTVLDLSFLECVSYLESIGEKSFRAKQVFDWIYAKGVFDFDDMNNLPPGLRRQMGQDLAFPPCMVLDCTDDNAGTKKFLFQLSDGQTIETVLISAAKRLTVCVSCQAGCRFSCRFCASGIGGWVRDLTCGEILMQILQAQKQVQRKITHVVFMGTGEPLDNWAQVKKAI